jgi:hypothetical protein
LCVQFNNALIITVCLRKIIREDFAFGAFK